MFFISKDKNTLCPLGLICKNLPTLIHSWGMRSQTIAVQLGVETKTYQNLMGCTFIPVMMKKHSNNIKAVSNGLYKCKSKGSHSVSKGHPLGCNIDTQRSLSTYKSTQVYMRQKSRLYGFTSYLDNAIWSHMS